LNRQVRCIPPAVRVSLQGRLLYPRKATPLISGAILSTAKPVDRGLVSLRAIGHPVANCHSGCLSRKIGYPGRKSRVLMPILNDRTCKRNWTLAPSKGNRVEYRSRTDSPEDGSSQLGLRPFRSIGSSASACHLLRRSSETPRQTPSPVSLAESTHGDSARDGFSWPSLRSRPEAISSYRGLWVGTG
jgi:hypothetical protein